MYITGYKTEADQVLSVFSWGHSFISLNAELLDAYAACSDAQDIQRVQQEWSEMLGKERRDRVITEYGQDLISDSDDSIESNAQDIKLDAFGNTIEE